MSPFIIFLIVVNIGYVLYYAAIITIDMNSKGKQTEDNTVNVEVEGITDDQIPDDDTPEETSSPIIGENEENEYASGSELDYQQSEYTDEFHTEDIASETVEDNPYGLTDEDEGTHTLPEDSMSDTSDGNVNDENKPSEVEDQESGNQPSEPELKIYEPAPQPPTEFVQHINAQSELITIESTMPVQPHMMAKTLLKARGLIKEEMEKEEFNEERTQVELPSNGISNETEVFDRI